MRFAQTARLLCAIAFVFLFLLVPVRAQELRGKIKGRVLDQNKAVVPGATVKVTDTSRNATVTLTTNADGLFEAPYLLPGVYQVVVEAPGFKNPFRTKSRCRSMRHATWKFQSKWVELRKR